MHKLDVIDDIPISQSYYEEVAGCSCAGGPIFYIGSENSLPPTLSPFWKESYYMMFRAFSALRILISHPQQRKPDISR